MNAPSSAPPTPQPRRSGIIVPHSLRWPQRLVAFLICLLIRGLGATLRFQWHFAPAVLEREPRPAILCTWHNRLALALILYRHYVRQRRQPFRMAAMVSASKDGAVVARILQHFRVQPVRGSSSRRGPQALLEMTGWAERGYDLAVTPDGPRGPRYRAQDGAVSLAQVTGLPIIPASCHIRWKKCMGSWDGFQIPLPFSRVVVRFGEPMAVPRDVSEPDRERFRGQLEQILIALGDDSPHSP
ncbi:MAG: lysophospholipid acyltransferase family protein [Verrucomicrobia bacterium]|nr:lysophospholipid acyltransferase family protein [Verrucomicrobiota bacterium]